MCMNFPVSEFSRSQIRGATNAVMKLVKEAEDSGKEKPVVVTNSSGNHAQGLSLAAKLCGIQAQVVMPRTCPTSKVRAVEGYGGVVTFSGPSEQVRVVCAGDKVYKVSS